VWGPAAPFDVYLADDQFAELAVRLWARLFAAEVLR
jgi:hypothetical protein